MIDAKIIVEAAIQNADKYNPCRSTLDREEACRASFKDGIEWYKEAIWHDKSEEPTQEGLIIVQGVLNGENLANGINWKEVLREGIETGKKTGYTQEEIDECLRIAWKEFGNFDKWCYIDDILPKGGEK